MLRKWFFIYNSNNKPKKDEQIASRSQQQKFNYMTFNNQIHNKCFWKTLSTTSVIAFVSEAFRTAHGVDKITLDGLGYCFSSYPQMLHKLILRRIILLNPFQRFSTGLESGLRPIVLNDDDAAAYYSENGNGIVSFKSACNKPLCHVHNNHSYWSFMAWMDKHIGYVRLYQLDMPDLILKNVNYGCSPQITPAGYEGH